jgi:hypothetical protein
VDKSLVDLLGPENQWQQNNCHDSHNNSQWYSHFSIVREL